VGTPPNCDVPPVFLDICVDGEFFDHVNVVGLNPQTYTVGECPETEEERPVAEAGASEAPVASEAPAPADAGNAGLVATNALDGINGWALPGLAIVLALVALAHRRAAAGPR
jgi:hypothetical protein